MNCPYTHILMSVITHDNSQAPGGPGAMTAEGNPEGPRLHLIFKLDRQAVDEVIPDSPQGLFVHNQP